MVVIIDMEGHIWFYDHKTKPYGIFSNFAEIPFVVGGIKYPTSETYYQSKKFEGADASDADLEYAELIISQNTGGKAAILARQAKPKQNYNWAKELWVIIQEYISRGVRMRDDWDKVKDNVMREAVYNKFNQNPKLKKVLIDTNTAQLAEHTHRDDYWGDGHPYKDPTILGDGKNMLGKILEEVRYIFNQDTLSSRYKDMFVKGGKWAIPGYIFLADCSVEEAIRKGYRYIFSKREPYGCTIRGNVLLANWGDNMADKNKRDIAKTIEISVSRGLRVIVPFGHSEIVDMAIRSIYKIS